MISRREHNSSYDPSAIHVSYALVLSIGDVISLFAPGFLLIIYLIFSHTNVSQHSSPVRLVLEPQYTIVDITIVPTYVAMITTGNTQCPSLSDLGISP